MSEVKVDPDNSNERQWKIPKERELRFEAGESEVTIVLLQGTAEVFGTELALQRAYNFVSQKGAVFTYKDGCVVLVSGSPSNIYLADSETPMIKYCNLHAGVERLRNNASSQKRAGPRMMVVGPQDSGKSTLCRILLNYAFRARRAPMFVDLDVGQNAITIPGVVAATPIRAGFEVEGGLAAKAEIAYFFGHISPDRSPEFYVKLCERLAQKCEERLNEFEDEKYSGMIINTCGWVEEKGYELLLDVAKLFKIDLVVALGDEKLADKLKSDQRLDNKVPVIRLDKSGGVVNRGQKERRALRQASFHEYFYGTGKSLCAHSQSRQFHEIQCLRSTGGSQAPLSALPIGKKPHLDPNRQRKVDMAAEDMKQAIVGVSFGDKGSTTLSEEPIAGFAHVTEHDIANQNLVFLVPSPDLPREFTVLLGSLKWTEG